MFRARRNCWSRARIRGCLLRSKNPDGKTEQHYAADRAGQRSHHRLILIFWSTRCVSVFRFGENWLTAARRKAETRLATYA